MAFLYSVLYVLILGILSHMVGEAIPRTKFNPHAFPFRAWRWEREGKIYDKLGIRKWKDRLPDMSRVMPDMLPKRLGVAPKARNVRLLIAETCRAEAVHLALCLLAPVVWIFWKNLVGVLLTVLIILGNLPFILIQRYNRPALISLARRLAAREERKRSLENSDSVSKHGGRPQRRRTGDC